MIHLSDLALALRESRRVTKQMGVPLVEFSLVLHAFLTIQRCSDSDCLNSFIGLGESKLGVDGKKPAHFLSPSL